MFSGDWAAFICFGFAILHSFSVQKLRHLSRKFTKDSMAQNLFELLSEIEIVFGLWAGVYLVF
ncbi:MAG: putative Na+/H+ antiporter, partial [Bdellovibrionota bacterium]